MLATPRYRAGTKLGQIIELPDGQFFTMTAEGKPPFQETLGYESFDDPWTPEHLVVRRGRGVPIVWSAPEVVHTMPGSAGLWGVGRALVDQNGDLHAIGLRFLKWPKDIERPGRDEMRCDVFHVASRDGGVTWEPPHRVDYGREYTGALLGFTQLSSGRLVLPIHFYDFDRAAARTWPSPAIRTTAGARGMPTRRRCQCRRAGVTAIPGPWSPPPWSLATAASG